MFEGLTMRELRPEIEQHLLMVEGVLDVICSCR